MQKSTLVIFTGLPGTGKTTLSERLSNELNIPLIAKDAIKELMFDELGWSNKEFTTKLAHATFRIMDYVIEGQLRAGNNLIVESNFMPRLASDKFKNWQQDYNYNVIQIVCRTDLEALAKRCHERSLANRHPGHGDRSSVEEHRRLLAQRVENDEDQPLDLSSKIYVLDTTDFGSIDFEGLVAEITCDDINAMN